MNKICVFCGCNFIVRQYRAARAKYCGYGCYHQSLKSSPETAFWKHVEKTETCWVWTASRFYTGYGQFRHGSAHRFSWELHNGHIPEGMSVLHRCDNRPCVRPDHLFLGTLNDNIQDCIQKGRRNHATGAALPQTILTAEMARLIRARYPAETLSAIARDFGVAPGTIHAVVSFKTFKYA